MGLYAFEVETIASLIKRLPPNPTVLSLGHPDILATPEELHSFVGKTLKIDNAEVREARGGIPGKRVVGNARIVFDALGAKLVTLDIRKHLYNVDIEADLNYPVDVGQFDLVIDGGATEHCFNVGQALKNVAEAVKVGGFAYHMVPLCHWNHGFWNFSPGVFADLYDEPHGFKVEKLTAEYRGTFIPVNPSKKFEIPTKGRKLNLICVAHKFADKKISFPMQRKYR